MVREVARAAHDEADLCGNNWPMVAPGGVDSALVEKGGDADEVDNDNNDSEAQNDGQGGILVWAELYLPYKLG